MELILVLRIFSGSNTDFITHLTVFLYNIYSNYCSLSTNAKHFKTPKLGIPHIFTKQVAQDIA